MKESLTYVIPKPNMVHNQQKIDSKVEEVRTKALERIASMQDKDSRERDFKIADIIKDVVSKEPKQKKENDNA